MYSSMYEGLSPIQKIFSSGLDPSIIFCAYRYCIKNFTDLKNVFYGSGFQNLLILLLI